MKTTTNTAMDRKTSCHTMSIRMPPQKSFHTWQPTMPALLDCGGSGSARWATARDAAGLRRTHRVQRQQEDGTLSEREPCDLRWDAGEGHSALLESPVAR